MAINFFLKDKTKKKTSIEAIIRFKGKRYKIAIGESVIVKYWNKNKNRLREVKSYQEAPIINLRLIEWENTLKEVCNNFVQEMKTPTPQEFKALVDKKSHNEQNPDTESFTDFIERFIPGSGRAYRTQLSYGSTLNCLRRFELSHDIRLQFQDINMKFYNEFKSFMEEEKKSKNYFGTMIKNIKLFMQEAREEGLHNSLEHRNNKFKTTGETADSVYLNEEELLRIHNLQFTEELIREHYPEIRRQNMKRKMEALELVRNRFLIGAYTALRVSDFNRLTEININKNFIRIKPSKGSTIRKNDDVVIPVHWIIHEIMVKGFDLNKTITEQKINEHIKEICKMAKINAQISVSRTQGGQVIEKIQPKYELVTTHTARRSGATNMFNAGIEPIRIMKITGHRTEKAFLKYIRITQEENAKTLADHPFFKKPPMN